MYICLSNQFFFIVYFAPESYVHFHRNTHQHCKNSFNKNDASYLDARKFKDKIKYYCIYKGFVFNPSEMLDKSGRIMSDSKEHFYIESKFDIQKLKNDKPEFDNEDNNNQEPVLENSYNGEMPF